MSNYGASRRLEFGCIAFRNTITSRNARDDGFLRTSWTAGSLARSVNGQGPSTRMKLGWSRSLWGSSVLGQKTQGHSGAGQSEVSVISRVTRCCGVEPSTQWSQADEVLEPVVSGGSSVRGSEPTAQWS